MGSEGGQATLEWTGLVLLVSLALLGALGAAPEADGRSFGGFLAHRLVCAVRGGCHDGDAALVSSYGRSQAELARRHAPNIVYEGGERQLPVDYRRCRTRRCADAPEHRDADVHRTRSGERATVFTHVLRRGGRTYVQYWLYYPESNSTWMGSDALWERSYLLPLIGRVARGTSRYPGFHLDDWEGYQVRIEPSGRVYARATSHGHYQGCKQAICKNRWIGGTGWTRVSRGSHAGHIPLELERGRRRRKRRLRPRYPGPHMRERSTTAEGLRLIPLERLNHRRYRRADPEIAPPWSKRPYRDPESDSS